MNVFDWLGTGDHLPEPLRDFHDQKNLFKYMHQNYDEQSYGWKAPTWSDGHCYVIDWFLWLMASRGYTLQKTRKKNVEFMEWPTYTPPPFPLPAKHDIRE